MKHIITTFLGIVLLLSAKAQTVQLLTNTAHEFGFVDATKTNFYTYNDISNTNPNAAANFELKKFDPVTNTFSVVFTMPNNNNFTDFYPLTILNSKCLFVGKHLDSLYKKRNYFVYDGFNLDSILPQSVYDFGETAFNYLDFLNQKVYFAVPFFGNLAKTDIYVSDFTKIGTKKKYSFNDAIRPKHGLYGMDSTIYFITNYGGKIMKLKDSIASSIDSLNSFPVTFNYMHKDDINNEIYFYKGQPFINNTNNSVFKINAQGQKIFLLGIPSTGNGHPGYTMLGKVANKLLFLGYNISGLVTYDILNGQIDTLYKVNSVIEPVIGPPAEIAIPFFSKSNNHMYFYTIRKMWVTDGLSVKALNAIPANNIDSVCIPFTVEAYSKISFCNENWISSYGTVVNDSNMIMFDPNANSSITCFQSSDPNINCFFSSAHQVNNTTYILSKSNLYEMTNCSISTDLSQPNASKNFVLFPNPAADKISIGDFVFENLEVYNQLGVLVLRVNNASTFSTAALAPGIYRAKMRIGNAMVVKSFVKQ